MVALPSEFIEQLRSLLGEEAGALINALDREPVVSIRLNRRKPGAAFPGMEPVAWCPSGYYLPKRPEFILDPLLHAGAYYVQDASSMIYEETLTRIIKTLCKVYPNSKLNILDLCAAPGGKTTAMINALPAGSKVTANEYSSKRAGILKENLAKWGYPEVTVTNKDSSYYASIGEAFDIIAVDTPCSGEGMMRKDEFARQQWSPQLVEQCSALQKEILSNAVKTLKPGGFLIYSTCTFNRRENEENAEFLVRESGMEPWDPDFPKEWGIPSGIKTDLPVYRFMPHKTRGEGLFLAVFRKPGDWSPISSKGKKNIPQKITKDSIPAIEDILDENQEKTGLPRVELSLEDAIRYLRRESIAPPGDLQKGPVIVTYKNLNLGAAKNIGNRLNNLYPKNWRILKQ
ncbi:MAG: hypothetical protein J1E82_02585 [Muribaculaceae bacterium]|nr:hypothetical protein [Muribaculaceae bacterium]